MSAFSAVFFGMHVTFLSDRESGLNSLLILIHHSVDARTNELVLGLV